MQDFDFILNHCDSASADLSVRTIELYQKVEKNLIDKNLSPISAKWVQEELQKIKSLIQGYQESEAEEMADFFGQN